MTVRELIDALQKMDPDIMVVVDGYEGGVTEVTSTVLTEIVRDYNEPLSYYGPHELRDSAYLTTDEELLFRTEPVVYLPRRSV